MRKVAKGEQGLLLAKIDDKAPLDGYTDPQKTGVAPLEPVAQRAVVFSAPQYAVAAARVTASGLRPRELPWLPGTKGMRAVAAFGAVSTGGGLIEISQGFHVPPMAAP